MKHELLLLGKAKDTYIEEGIREYSSRLSHYTSITLTTLKDKSSKIKGQSNLRKIVQHQGDTLIKAVSAGAMKIVLDAGGRQLTSEQFAEKINTWEMQGVKKACYLIGGPDGHSTKVKTDADFLFSLSTMTFTHDMVRLLLVEQLYRAYTIKAGEHYHK